MMASTFAKAAQAKESTLKLSDAMDRLIEKLDDPKPKRRPSDAQMLNIRSIHEC